MRRGI